MSDFQTFFCLSDKIVRFTISKGQILTLLLAIIQDEENNKYLTSELYKVTKSAISPQQKLGSLRSSLLDLLRSTSKKKTTSKWMRSQKMRRTSKMLHNRKWYGVLASKCPTESGKVFRPSGQHSQSKFFDRSAPFMRKGRDGKPFCHKAKLALAPLSLLYAYKR